MRPLLLSCVLLAASCSGDDTNKPTETKQAAPPEALPEKKPEPEPEKEPEKEPEPPKPTAPPNPQPKLTVVHDGKPVQMQAALAYSRGHADSVTVMVGNQPMSCEEKLQGVRSIPDGEVAFDLMLTRVVLKDGSRPWQLSQFSYPGMTIQQSAEVSLAGEFPPTGDRLTGTLNPISIKRSMIEDKGELANLSGEFSAIWCGDHPYENQPEPRPEGATWTVTGTDFPLRGATVRVRDGKTELSLSTEPQSCDRSAGPEGGELRLRIAQDTGKIEFGHVSGYLFPTQLNVNNWDKSSYKIELGGPAEGEGDVEITLSGKATLFDYKTRLSGKISALRCSK